MCINFKTVSEHLIIIKVTCLHDVFYLKYYSDSKQKKGLYIL